MGYIIRGMIVDENEIMRELETFCSMNNIDNPDKFIAITIVELGVLHCGAIIALGVTEGVFEDWRGRYKAAQSE